VFVSDLCGSLMGQEESLWALRAGAT